MKNLYKDFKIIKIDDKFYKISYFFTNLKNEYVFPSEVDKYIYTHLHKRILLLHSPYTISYDSMTWYAISLILENPEYKLTQEVFEKKISNLIDDKSTEEDKLFCNVMREVFFIQYQIHFHSYIPLVIDKYPFLQKIDNHSSSVIDLTQQFYINHEEKKE